MLANWLRAEDELRGRVSLAGGPVAPGHMGVVDDVVQVAVGSGGAVTVLVTSLFAWLHHRRSAQRVTMRITLDNGATVEFTCGSSDNAAVLLDRLHGMIGD